TSFPPMVGIFGVFSIGLNAIQLAAVAAGLIISLRYRWLSDRMWLIVTAFAALAAIAGVQVLSSILTVSMMLNFAKFGSLTAGSNPGGIAMMAAGGGAMLSMIVAPLAWVCLVVGFALVWREACDRLRGLRELLDERRSAATEQQAS